LSIQLLTLREEVQVSSEVSSRTLEETSRIIEKAHLVEHFFYVHEQVYGHSDTLSCPTMKRLRNASYCTTNYLNAHKHMWFECEAIFLKSSILEKSDKKIYIFFSR
jgi:hypothetical protein